MTAWTAIPDGETPAVEMERAVNEWLREQSAAGLVVSSSGRETQAEMILRELKHQPDIKYVSQPKQDKRNQNFVSAEVHRGSLGISRSSCTASS